jgi:lysozyme
MGEGISMTRRCTPEGIALIKQFEECRLTAYLCPASKWTCGWGETEDVTRGTTWTQEEADRRFDLRLRRTEAAVEKMLMGTKVPDSVFSAMVSWVYNVGEGAAAKSTLVRKVRAGDLMGGWSELPRWCHSNGVLLSGLVRRRKAEQDLWLGPRRNSAL